MSEALIRIFYHMNDTILLFNENLFKIINVAWASQRIPTTATVDSPGTPGIAATRRHKCVANASGP
jgi:hypothetical protein